MTNRAVGNQAMLDHRFGGAILLLLGIAMTAPAYADGPKAGFKLNAEETFASPDQTLRVEQYSKELKDQGVLYHAGFQGHAWRPEGSGSAQSPAGQPAQGNGRELRLAWT